MQWQQNYGPTHSQTFIHSLVFSLEGQAWQEPEPSHVTGMALAHCILGKFLGVVCHCFPSQTYVAQYYKLLVAKHATLKCRKLFCLTETRKSNSPARVLVYDARSLVGS